MSNLTENKFYKEEKDGSLTLIRVEQVDLGDPIKDKEEELLRLYKELETLKNSQEKED